MKRNFFAVLLAVALLAESRSAEAQSICNGTAPVPGAVLSSFPVVTGLTGLPLLVTAPPGDLTRLFIVEQTGLIRVHQRGTPTDQAPVFLDITDRVLSAYFEMGLLGLAFDPDYQTNGLFYVNYTAGPGGGPWSTVVSRFSRSAADPNLADPASEVHLLTFEQPEVNHNGGQVMFGPDGFLYVATGDGGGGGDQHGTCGNGQNRDVLLGKMLRLDVRNIDPSSVPPDCGGPGSVYRIPSSNPFALSGNSDCGEIWTYGLRNPWRSDFDPVTGDLYIGDVGQACWEEVDVLPGGGPPGANLGWRSMEGMHCYDGTANCDPAPVVCAGIPTCGDPSLRLPVLEYGHDKGCTIIGGAVYRGCQMPDWSGTYFYGDICSGFVASFRMVGGVPQDQADRTSLLDPGQTLGGLSSFGEDAQGEIYLVDRDGIVSRIGPRFIDLEVSARGDASPLLLNPGAWTWGDLAYSSMRPISFYRVYRGTPGGTFHCRFTSATPAWSGGDPDVPALGQLFAYVVTAVAPSGEETRPGIAAQGFVLDDCQ